MKAIAIKANQVISLRFFSPSRPEGPRYPSDFFFIFDNFYKFNSVNFQFTCDLLKENANYLQKLSIMYE